MGISNPGGSGFTDILKWYDPGPLAAPGRFDVASVPQGYNLIKLVLFNLRSSVVAAADDVYLLFNGDTTLTNYRHERLSVALSSASVSGGDLPKISVIPGASATATYVSNIIVDIFSYTNTSKHKISKVYGAGRRSDGTEAFIEDFTLAWESTAAINRITVQPDGFATDNFPAGSQLQIWLYK